MARSDGDSWIPLFESGDCLNLVPSSIPLFEWYNPEPGVSAAETGTEKDKQTWKEQNWDVSWFGLVRADGNGNWENNYTCGNWSTIRGYRNRIEKRQWERQEKRMRRTQNKNERKGGKGWEVWEDKRKWRSYRGRDNEEVSWWFLIVWKCYMHNKQAVPKQSSQIKFVKQIQGYWRLDIVFGAQDVSGKFRIFLTHPARVIRFGMIDRFYWYER